MNATRIDAHNLIDRSLEKVQGQKFQENAWGRRHYVLWSRVRAGGIPLHYKGAGVVLMVEGWARQADKHFELYESLIGDDGVLGPAWEAIGRGIIALLNGETGDLDCGTVDGLVRDIATSNGVEGDTI